jgi:pyruvate dehydrogenase E2 component (dihydrolipoamide acetyltransferase)
VSVIKDFKLPDLGEGLTESELVSWHVEVGDTVQLNEIIADVETAKALVELPSPYAGVVARLYVEPGITVNVGEPLLAFEVEGDTDSNAGADGTADAAGLDVATAAAGALDVATAADVTGATAAIPDDASDVAEPNLVGYGATSERTGRPARRARVISGSGVSPVSLARLSSPDALSATADHLTPASSPEALERPRSTPPVRKLARDLGIELEQIAGTGEQGVITREDVQRAVSPDEQHEPGAALHEHATSAALQHATSAPPVPTKRETRGSIERETRSPIKGVRKYTAEAMVASAFTAPHVTTFLTVDVTPTLELLAHLKQLGEFSGYRLNFLTAVAKAVCIAVARTPVVNSRWDESAGEIVQFNYVNLGIAAATPRGLMVPTIKDADRMTLPDLATALADLVETAKAGRTNQEQLSGGTISITNVGVFGVDAGTPILNPGEAAILAIGAIRRRPWEHEGQVALRDVVTLSLSFDHRLVDGEQGSRFLADVGAILAEPGFALTMV